MAFRHICHCNCVNSRNCIPFWLAEQITAKGVGNGISIIIFAGIVAAIPNAVNQIYAQQIEGAGDQLFIKIAIMALLTFSDYCNYCWSYLCSTSIA